MSSKLEYDIKEKYGYELNEISNKLNQIEAGRIYENSFWEFIKDFAPL